MPEPCPESFMSSHGYDGSARTANFTVDGAGVELTRAYDEGMRIDVDELLACITPIQEPIERGVRE